MFDVKTVLAEAQAEINAERAKEAKAKIKAKLSQIAAGERVLVNLKREYEVLLREIGAEG